MQRRAQIGFSRFRVGNVGLAVLSMQNRHLITGARTKFIGRATAVAMKVTQDDDSNAIRPQNRHHHHHDDSDYRRDDDDDDDDDDGDDPNHHKRHKRCNRPLTLAGYLMGSQPCKSRTSTCTTDPA